jgi:hypothetical protein
MTTLAVSVGWPVTYYLMKAGVRRSGLLLKSQLPRKNKYHPPQERLWSRLAGIPGNDGESIRSRASNIKTSVFHGTAGRKYRKVLVQSK